MPASTRAALDTLCWLLDDAFEGDGAQSLLASLRGMTEAEWTALPAGAGAPGADGQHWPVRLNDFPDAFRYTLLVDGTPLGDFHDGLETGER